MAYSERIVAEDGNSLRVHGLDGLSVVEGALLTPVGPLLIHVVVPSAAPTWEVGTSPPAGTLPPFPLAWWDDVVLRGVPDWYPDALLGPYDVRQTEWGALYDVVDGVGTRIIDPLFPWQQPLSVPIGARVVTRDPLAVDRAKRRARAKELGLLFDDQTGLILVPADYSAPQREPFMVDAIPLSVDDQRLLIVKEQRSANALRQARGGGVVDYGVDVLRRLGRTAVGHGVRALMRSILLDPLFWAAIALRIWVPALGWVPLVTYGVLQLAATSNVDRASTGAPPSSGG